MVLKTIINELLELPSVCKSFSSRNVLEVLALLDGEKKVVRVPIKNHEWDILRTFCEKNSLSICHSNFKIAVVRETPLGDIFTENVTWDSDSDRMLGFVAYISMSKEVSQLASDMESNADSNELGELYQYPSCCVETYSNKIEDGEFWLEVLLSNSRGINYSFYSNKLAYLFDETSIISDYFPCSLNCEKTISIGKSYRDILLKNNLVEFYDNIRKVLCKPIIVGDGFLLQFEKNALIINSENSQLFQWKNKEEYRYLYHESFTINVDYDLNKVVLDNKSIGKLFQFSDK